MPKYNCKYTIPWQLFKESHTSCLVGDWENVVEGFNYIFRLADHRYKVDDNGNTIEQAIKAKKTTIHGSSFEYSEIPD